MIDAVVAGAAMNKITLFYDTMWSFATVNDSNVRTALRIVKSGVEANPIYPRQVHKEQ